MAATLHDQPELNDLSLLVLCDVAVTSNGKRLAARFQTLLTGRESGACGRGFVPKPIQALAAAGLVEVRKSTRDKSAQKATEPGWSVHLTDKGQLCHRAFVANLRQAAA